MAVYLFFCPKLLKGNLLNNFRKLKIDYFFIQNCLKVEQKIDFKS